MSPGRVILFDAVGTLIHCEPSVASVYHRFGVKHGSHRTVEEIEARFASAFKQLAPSGKTSRAIERDRWRQVVEGVFDDSPDAGGELFEELWQHFAGVGNWRLFDDVREVLRGLDERGYSLGVASNFDERLPPIIKRLCPAIPSDRVFHSADVGWAKPNPKFYETIQDLLGIDADQIVMVGDHWVNDFAAPRQVGWHSIEIRRADGTSEGPECISSLTRLLGIL